MFCCRRATSNDDSVTLKNCSSDSTLNGDVTRAPAVGCSDVTDATHQVRRLGLSTFNPLGCRQYSAAAELQHSVPRTARASSAGNHPASTTRSGKPPNPPRRTTSLSTRVPSLPPLTAVEMTSEIQRLASLAEKLAASRRVSAISSRTLPPPRSAPSLVVDPNPLFRDKSPTFAVVATSRSDIKTSLRLDLTASYLSDQTVAEKEEDENSVIATDINGYLPQLSSTLSTVCAHDESASASTLRRTVSPHHSDSGSNSVFSQYCGREDVVTAENSIALLAGPGKESEFVRDIEEDGRSTQNDDITADKRDPAVGTSPLNVSHDCCELGVSRATMLVSSSVKDSLTMTADDCGGGPLPVAARLIITSPVSSRACFVENPHRRSMCKPLTLPVPRVDGVDQASGSVQISDTLHPVTSLRRRNCNPELPAVVVNGNDDIDPINYSRSWYDVIRGDNGRCNLGIVAAEPRCYTTAPPVVGAGFSFGGDCSSSDTRSVSSQSSLVSDKSSQMSGSLRRPTSRPISETSTLSGGQDPRVAVRINASSSVSTSRPRSSSSKGHHSIQSLGAAAAADHTVSKSSEGENVDGVVTKGTNLKRLKKSKHWVMRQLKKDADVDLNADIQRLSRRGADRTATNTAVGCPTNDGRWNRENETESRPVFTSFTSNSLGRHKSLRTCSKFADHCSTAGNIIVSPQLRTAATQH